MTGFRLAGAVLAGGRSRRMGRTKALVEVDGVTMADRVIRALCDVGADPVFVFGGDGDELAALGAPVIPDEFPGEGPVGGVLGALNHVVATADFVAILPCDVALIGQATLAPLVDAVATADGRIVVARTDRMEPMCAIWPIEVRHDVAARFETGERALHRVIEHLRHVEVDVGPQGLVNINAPDDLPG